MFTRNRMIAMTAVILVAAAIAATSPQWLPRARGLVADLQGGRAAPAADVKLDDHDHSGHDHNHNAHGHEGHNHGHAIAPGPR